MLRLLRWMNVSKVVAALLAGGGWISSLHAEDAAEKITYAEHVQPLFRARCGSCHNASDRKGGLAVDSYSLLMEGGSSGAVVEPGDAENSYLYSLVTHESEPRMPPNSEKIPATELALIQKWIDLGALENSGSTAMVKKKASLAKIEVSATRPENVAWPERYFGDPLHRLTSRQSVTALAVSPWASLAAVSGHEQVALYDSSSLEPRGVLAFPEGQPQIIKFSRNAELVLVGGGKGGASGRVIVYDVRTGERKIEVGDEYDEVLAADISPDQTQVALGGPKRMLRVYSTSTGELLYEKNKHTDWLTSLEYSPDGVLLATGDRSNGLIIWEAFTGELFHDLQGHKGAVTDISWRPDSNAVASSSEDGTVKVWEMQNGTVVKSWDAHSGGALSLEYTRDGKLVSTGRDKQVKLWAGDGAKEKEFAGLTDLGMEVAYDAEAQRVLAGDLTGRVLVWDAASGEQLGELSTNPPTVETALSQLRTRADEAAMQLATRSADLKTRRDQLAMRAAAASALEAKWKQAQEREQKAKDESAALNASVEKLTADLEAMKARSREQGQKSKALTQQVEARRQELAAAQEQVAKLPQAIETNQQRLRAAEQALQQTIAARATAEAVAQPTVEESKLADDAAVKESLAQRAAVVEVARQAAAAQQKKLDSLRQTLLNEQQALDAAQKIVAGHEPQLKELATQLASTAEALQSAMTAQAAGEVAFAEATERRKQLSSAHAALTAEVKTTREAFEAAQTKAAPTPEEAKALAEAEQAVQQLESSAKRLREACQRLEKVQGEFASAAK